MVLDYSGRRPVPKNDSSGRRPVPKNRPRKQPVGIFILILISAVSMSFAMGVLTGWFVFKPARKAAQAQEARAAAANNAQPSAAQAPYQNPEAGPAKAGEPPLTFFETLPKGGKAVIGSGLNPRKAEEPQPPKAVVPSPAPAQQAAPTEQGKKPEKGEAPAPQKETAGKFCVQVASTQERSEAESLKTKLTAKGLPAYIVESSIKDRGTWFRIRIGKHLSPQAAGDFAVKAGKGAMVVSE